MTTPDKPKPRHPPPTREAIEQAIRDARRAGDMLLVSMRERDLAELDELDKLNSR